MAYEAYELNESDIYIWNVFHSIRLLICSSTFYEILWFDKTPNKNGIWFLIFVYHFLTPVKRGQLNKPDLCLDEILLEGWQLIQTDLHQKNTIRRDLSEEALKRKNGLFEEPIQAFVYLVVHTLDSRNPCSTWHVHECLHNSYKNKRWLFLRT